MPILKKFILALFLFQETVQESKDLINDKLKYEIAVAQRDYLIVKEQLNQVLIKLKGKLEEANKICSEAGKKFDSDSMTCK